MLREDISNTLHAKIMVEGLEFFEKRGKLVSSLYRQGLLDEEDLNNALRVAVFEEARRDYYWIRADGLPDFFNGEFFAYAILEGVISTEQASKLPFDVEGFCQRYYEKNLIQKLKMEYIKSEL